MLNVHVACKGIAPLLMNPMGEAKLEGLRTGIHPPREEGLSREDEASMKIYPDPEGKGRFGIPSENLMSCLIRAGQFVPNKVAGQKGNISTADSTALFSFFDIYTGEFMPFHDQEAASQWTADMRRGQLKTTGRKVAVPIVRPKFEGWSFEVEFGLDLALCAEKTIRQLFLVAGRRIGLCDFRPDRKGRFGRFIVDLWESTSGDDEEAETIADESRDKDDGEGTEQN